MKKTFLILICLIAATVSAQTSKEITGSWKLAKWFKNDTEKNIKDFYKTSQVFYKFQKHGTLEIITGTDSQEAKWKLSKNDTELTITTPTETVLFSVDSFTPAKLVITSPQKGILEFKSVVPE